MAPLWWTNRKCLHRIHHYGIIDLIIVTHVNKSFHFGFLHWKQSNNSGIEIKWAFGTHNFHLISLLRFQFAFSASLIYSIIYCRNVSPSWHKQSSFIAINNLEFIFIVFFLARLILICCSLLSTFSSSTYGITVQ